MGSDRNNQFIWFKNIEGLSARLSRKWSIHDPGWIVQIGKRQLGAPPEDQSSPLRSSPDRQVCLQNAKCGNNKIGNLAIETN